MLIIRLQSGILLCGVAYTFVLSLQINLIHLTVVLSVMTMSAFHVFLPEFLENQTLGARQERRSWLGVGGTTARLSFLPRQVIHGVGEIYSGGLDQSTSRSAPTLGISSWGKPTIHRRRSMPPHPSPHFLLP